MTKLIQFNALNLIPQSADPSSPAEGDIFRSDGTSRSKGVWEYRDSAWQQVGGSGGGGLDVFHTQDMENYDMTSDPTSGLNATYKTAGTFGGTLANDTSTPISSLQSGKYTAGATSDNDWFDLESISLDLKQRGRSLGVSLEADMSGFANDVTFVAYDVTNGNVLTSSLDVLTASASRQTYYFSFFVPSSCTSISYGFHMKGSTTNTESFTFDDLEFSTNPFKYGEIIDPEVDTIKYASADITSVGTVADFAVTDLEIGAEYDLIMNMQMKWVANNGTLDITATHDSSTVGYLRYFDVAAKTFDEHQSRLSSFTATATSISFSVSGVSGSTYYTGNGTNTESHIILRKKAKVKDSVILPVEAGSQIIRYDGFSSITSDYLKLTTRQYNKDANGGDTSLLFSDDNSGTFTKITAVQPCNFSVTANGEHSAANTIKIQRFNSSDVEQESNKNEQNTGYNSASTTAFFRMDAGDYIKVYYNVASPVVTDAESFYLQVIGTPLKSQALTALPVEQVQYFEYNTSGSRHTVTTSETQVTLNDTHGDSFGTLTSNDITLPKGKYEVCISALLFHSLSNSQAVIYLYDVTNSAVVADSYSPFAAGDTSLNTVYSQVSKCINLEITESTTYDLRTIRASSTGSCFIGDSATGIYANGKALVKIRKLK